MNLKPSRLPWLVVVTLGFTMSACGAGEPSADADAQAVDGGSISDVDPSDRADGASLLDSANDSLEDQVSVDMSETESSDQVTEDASTEEVEPGGPLEIELTWFAPGDLDPTDSGPGAGPDLDLHFMHPFAADWFDQPFDCFWFNPNPNWGSWDPTVDDDPSLFLDSTDGSGPESLVYDTMEVDSPYRIGVHVWSDQGFGPIEATIGISWGGELLYEATVTLKDRDLWEVATLHWTSGDLEVLQDDQGAPLVLPDYMNPFFSEP